MVDETTDVDSGEQDECTLLLSPGTLFAERYVIKDFLGEGGAAAVYSAHDRSLNTDIALKIMHRGTSTIRSYKRFRREARIAREATSPHLVKIYDIGQWHGQYYLTLELVKGRTLKQKIREEGPLSLEESRRILKEVAEGLSELHRRGIVHRDVKSSNILLDTNGFVKLGDMGLAKGEGDITLTQESGALGTPEYMAPEQVLGKKVTPATDIYSLGIVLYEMFTGDFLFKGESVIATAMKHVKEPPDFKKHGVKRKAGTLYSLLLQMVEKDSKDRPQDADALLRKISAPGSFYLSRGMKKRIVAIGIFLLAVVLVWYLVSRFVMNTQPVLNPTSLEVDGTDIICKSGEEVLWTKDFSQYKDNLLLFNPEKHLIADLDGDGVNEVVLARYCEFNGQTPFPIPVYSADGSEKYQISINPVEQRNEFFDFSQKYAVHYDVVHLEQFERPLLGIRFIHSRFYPSIVQLWDVKNEKRIFTFIMAGWIDTLFPWNGGLAFSGNLPRKLHMRYLALTEKLDLNVSTMNESLNDLHLAISKLKALHITQVAGYSDVLFLPDGVIEIKDEAGQIRKVLPDGRMEGQPTGAAQETLDLLFAYRTASERMRGGHFDAARKIILESIQRARDMKLKGHLVLFESLQSEWLYRTGDVKGAVDHCFQVAKEYPEYAGELPMIAGFYQYLAGHYAEAKDTWLNKFDASPLGSNKNVELHIYTGFATLLSNPGREAVLEETGQLFAEYKQDESVWQIMLNLERGWFELLNRNPKEAERIFKEALTVHDQEIHASGYFLSKIVQGTYSQRELDDYVAFNGARPFHLQWVEAVGQHQEETARKLWEKMETLAPHSVEVALMVPVLKRFREIYMPGGKVQSPGISEKSNIPSVLDR